MRKKSENYLSKQCSCWTFFNSYNLAIFETISILASCIGCFVCTSINHSEPECEDTFNNTNAKFYHKTCFSGRKGRDGLFPATNCVKLKAEIRKYSHYEMNYDIFFIQIENKDCFLIIFFCKIIFLFISIPDYFWYGGLSLSVTINWLWFKNMAVQWNLT